MHMHVQTVISCLPHNSTKRKINNLHFHSKLNTMSFQRTVHPNYQAVPQFDLPTVQNVS